MCVFGVHAMFIPFSWSMVLAVSCIGSLHEEAGRDKASHLSRLCPRSYEAESVTVVVLTMHALSYCSCTSKIGILVLRLFLSEGTEPTLWGQQ